MKCVYIKLWDILGCFHYILNAPRILAVPSCTDMRFLRTRRPARYCLEICEDDS